ncbi:MAG TPA: hypothetical protein VHX99_02345 [Rhizomicrobium sp.]|jgi:hypothetical protein|nr:hypothetical protein [Rhizomicrobium sp.]
MAKTQIIPPDSYPQMVSKGEAARISRALRSQETIQQGDRVIEEASHGLRDGVRDYVRGLETVIGDHRQTFEKAHEIRGFAETAGLAATGRIADGLCNYFDEMEKLAAEPDMEVIALHVSAIARAAFAEDEAIRMGNMVAKELATLVHHKLAETKAEIGD